MQIESILNNELQLGSQLNKSVCENRRNDFSWLLASLSQDALDFAQFHLPKTELAAQSLDEQQLRAQLGAPQPRPCAPPTFNVALTKHQCELIAMGARDTLRLQDCLAPTPLAVRDDTKHIPLPVVDNCSPITQAKLASQAMQLSEAQMDSAAFYDQITQINNAGFGALA
ncbi:VC2046/SO_2500 family protein [Pseudoalteromonas sp. SSDWG2]|uniref:VC2046/SO_2500 family protein n=1 Tax=Pseudoalteromonas sp. SSDWG2 TaxID=3139391 RepID=UPI003BAAA899